jgi:hypothetical protein
MATILAQCSHISVNIENQGLSPVGLNSPTGGDAANCFPAGFNFSMVVK